MVFNYKSRKKQIGLFVAIVFACLLAKVFLFFVLDAKYLADSANILNSIITNAELDASYMVPVRLNRPLYLLFHISDLRIWSLMYGFLGTAVFYILVRKFLRDYMNISNMVFVILTDALLNIYVFNLSKDVLIFFFLSVFALIAQSKFKETLKLFLCATILLLIAATFKTYYILILAFFIGFHFLFHFKNKSSFAGYFLHSVLLFVICFFVFLVGAKLIVPNQYNSLVLSRYSVNINRQNADYAQTIINDFFPNNQNILFDFLNCVVGLFRLIFPIELLDDGNLLYFFFFFYQLFIEAKILARCKASFNLVSKNTFSNHCASFYLALYLAYLFVSAIFEPDFGSFLRHEVSFISIPCLALIYESGLAEKKDKAIMYIVAHSHRGVGA